MRHLLARVGNINQAFREVGKLWTVAAQIFNCQTPAVLDSGSQFTAISQKLFKRLSGYKNIPLKKGLQATGANGELIDTIATISLPVSFESKVFAILNIQVVQDLPVDFILGSDLMDNRCILDFVKHRCMIYTEHQQEPVCLQMTQHCYGINQAQPASFILKGDLRQEVFYEVASEQDLSSVPPHEMWERIEQELIQIRRFSLTGIKQHDSLAKAKRQFKHLFQLAKNHPIIFYRQFFQSQTANHTETQDSPSKRSKDPNSKPQSGKQGGKTNQQLQQDLELELTALLEERLQKATSKAQKDQIKQQIQDLRPFILQFPRMFHKDFRAGELNVAPVKLEFSCDINTVTPIVAKIKPISIKERQILEKWFNEALSNGTIEHSNSTWRSTIFAVPKGTKQKPNGTLEQLWRIVTPFYGLNSLLNIRACLLPRLADIIVILVGMDYYSKLDLRNAFFQIPLHKDSRGYCAIAASGFRLMQYCVLPMGLSISSSIL